VNIRTQIGAVPRGVGVIHSERSARLASHTERRLGRGSPRMLEEVEAELANENVGAAKKLRLQ
jgi:hypothetical protein